MDVEAYDEELIELNKQNDRTWKRIHNRKGLPPIDMVQVFLAVEDIEIAEIWRKHSREDTN